MERPRESAPRTTGIAGLVERDGELAALDGLVAGLHDGGSLLVVRGPPGIGKSALLRHLTGTARAAGLQVLTAHGSQAESGAVFGIVRQLLAHRVAGAEPDERRLLLHGAAELAADVLGPAGPPPGRDDAARRLGLYWLCAGLAEQAPLVLAVDDAQWADGASLAFLGYLAHRIGDLPLLLVVATRDGPAAPGVSRLPAVPGARVLRPAPLSPTATAELIRAHGAEPSPGRVAEWHRLTGGNPLLLTELVAAGRAGRTSARLEGWVQVQLDGLGAAAVALAEACSVLDDGAPLPLATRLAGLDVDAGLSAADELLAASLLVQLAPVRFRHPLVRAAVAASLPPGRTATLHRQAARLLSADAAPPGAVAHHLLRLPPLGDGEVARALLSAAREAAEHADPAAVRRYVARAMAEPPPPHLRAELLTLDGRAAFHLGAADEAVDALTGALTATAGPVARAGVLRSLVSALLASARMGEAADLVDGELAALAHTDPELALAAEAEILSASRHTLAARLWNADRLRRRRGKVAGTTAGERLLLANLCTQVALDGGSAAEAAELAVRAASAGLLVAEQTADAMAVYQVVWVLCGAERLAQARSLLDAAMADATARGSAVGFVLASLFRSYLDLAGDDLTGAEAHTGAALDAAAALPDPLFHAPAVVAAAIDVHRERGALAAAQALAARYPHPAELPDSTPHRLLLHSRGLLALAAGQADAALADLEELDRRETDRHVLATHLTPRHVGLARALTAAGDPARAQPWARAAVEAAERWGTPRNRARALRALAATQQAGSALDVLHTAARLLDPPAGLDTGWLHHDTGVVLARLGRRADAAAALRTALDLGHRLGAGLLRDRAHVELVRLGYRPRRPASTGHDALTGSERRVVDLAAAGRSNRDIAQALFVTVRTVETHLTAAYRKLGITSRADL